MFGIVLGFIAMFVVFIWWDINKLLRSIDKKLEYINASANAAAECAYSINDEIEHLNATLDANATTYDNGA